jgi:hypothetical protein
MLAKAAVKNQQSTGSRPSLLLREKYRFIEMTIIEIS